MNVMLQVQLKDLVKALAGGNEATEFTKALALAEERSVNSRQDFITLFAEAWEETSNGMPLAQIFGTYEMRDKIGPESTNAEVIEVIRGEAESAISNSFNVLRNRIDRFGVTQPNIQKLGNSGRILVELPGVKEPERVRKLLREQLPSSSGQLMTMLRLNHISQKQMLLLQNFSLTQKLL